MVASPATTTTTTTLRLATARTAGSLAITAIAPAPPGLAPVSWVLHQAHDTWAKQGNALVDILVREMAAILR